MLNANPALKTKPLLVDKLLEQSAVHFVDNSPGLDPSEPDAGEGLGLVQAYGAVALAKSLCFCPGARIATPTGTVRVEDLKVGDQVITTFGGLRRIVWIGHGKVLATRGRRSAATPVIVRKGALAGNVPDADLRVTKGHSLYLDGVLIPVEFLVNHRTILWDDHAQVVSVYHIELDAHDVLLANGAPAESYRDDGNRWLFQNANSGWDQPPKPPCAPVLTGGPVVDGVCWNARDQGPDYQRRRIPISICWLMVCPRNQPPDWTTGQRSDCPNRHRLSALPPVPASRRNSA